MSLSSVEINSLKEAAEILAHCVNLLDSYDASTTPADYHFDQYCGFAEFSQNSVRQASAVIFNGCVTFSQVLSVIVGRYYQSPHCLAFYSEQSIYTVISYLAIFKLATMDLKSFGRILKTHSLIKVIKFLEFLYDEKNITSWMKQEWLKLYDPAYVEETLIQPLHNFCKVIRSLIMKLQAKVESGYETKNGKASLFTVPQPFKLHTTKPKPVPFPQLIPTVKPAKPVPKSTYQPPSEQHQLEVQKQLGQLRTQKLLEDANSSGTAKLSVPKRTLPPAAAAFEAERQREAAARFQRTRTPPYMRRLASPSHPGARGPADNPPIRMNAAAILRELKFYKRREQQLVQQLETLETSTHDAAEFERWQREMRERDESEELVAAQKRALENRLTRERAVLKQFDLQEQRKQEADRIRAELDEIRDLLAEEEQKDALEKKEIVNAVTNAHENSLLAKERVKNEKNQLARQVAAENKALKEQALAKAVEELRARLEMIHEIRCLEAALARAPRIRLVDLASSAGYGFLNEMSFIELRERLALLRGQQRQEEEDRRTSIIEEKKEKNRQLMDALETVARHRDQLTQAAAKRLEEKRKTTKEKLLAAGKPTPLALDPEVQALADQVARAKERVAERRATSTLALISAPAASGTGAAATSNNAAGAGAVSAPVTGARAKGAGGSAGGAPVGRAADERRRVLRREAADRTDDRWKRRAEALERVAQLQVAGIVKEPRTPPPILTSFPSD